MKDIFRLNRVIFVLSILAFHSYGSRICSCGIILFDGLF